MAKRSRTALAHMLISRVGPRLQPGTRSYARAWIRDGAMIGEGLLRLGRERRRAGLPALVRAVPVRQRQGAVLRRRSRRRSGAGERQPRRVDLSRRRDLPLHARPRVAASRCGRTCSGAVQYMDELRASERTEAEPRDEPGVLRPDARVDQPRRLFGQADAFVLGRFLGAAWLQGCGRDRAVARARTQTRSASPHRATSSRDDLHASLRIAMAQHEHRLHPRRRGARRLRCDVDDHRARAGRRADACCRRARCENTFERYWREFDSARKGDARMEGLHAVRVARPSAPSCAWAGATARTRRSISSSPTSSRAGWNQWAEVVSRTPRKPFFLGDLPHAWVASRLRALGAGHVRLRAPARRVARHRCRHSRRLADGEGIAIEGLRTPGGALSLLAARGRATSCVLEVGGRTHAAEGRAGVAAANGKETTRDARAARARSRRRRAISLTVSVGQADRRVDAAVRRDRPANTTARCPSACVPACRSSRARCRSASRSPATTRGCPATTTPCSRGCRSPGRWHRGSRVRCFCR